MSGSSSLSSMSTPANTVVETYHAPDGGYGWVRFFCRKIALTIILDSTSALIKVQLF